MIQWWAWTLHTGQIKQSLMTNTSPNLHDNAHIAAQSVQAYLMSAPRVLSAEWWTLLSLPGPGPRIVC